MVTPILRTPHITVLFVTLADKGPIGRQSDGVTVLQSNKFMSVMANQNDPSNVAALLTQCRTKTMAALEGNVYIMLTSTFPCCRQRAPHKGFGS